jgi:glycosyltransferase involved in cell wall biosynthesis
MKNVDSKLIIYGDGNFLQRAKLLVKDYGLENKVVFKGKVLPWELDKVTKGAFIGMNLVEAVGENQVLSLANKFFDYIQNGIPQLTMNFPEYKKINNEFEVALLLDELSVSTVSNAINELFSNKDLHLRLQENCLKAREVYNWQNEEKKLIDFYRQFNK